MRKVNPVRNSSRSTQRLSTGGVLNPAGIVLKINPAVEQRGIISNGVKFLTVVFLFILTFSVNAWAQSLQDYIKQGEQRYNVSDFRGALEAWEKGLALARKINNKQFTGIFFFHIGNAYGSLSDYLQALSYLEQAMKIFREIGNRKFEGAALGNIGNCYLHLGDYPRTISYCEQALKILKEVRDRNGEAFNLLYIGNTYKSLGDSFRALSFYEEALKVCREIGDKKGEAAVLTNIGDTYSGLGNYPKALFFCKEAIEINREIRNRNGEGYELLHIGKIYSRISDYFRALSYYEQSLKIAREIGDKKGEGAILTNIGDTYSCLGDYPKAFFYFEQSLKTKAEIRVPTRREELTTGDIYLEQGMLKEAYEVFKRLNHPLHLGKYYLKTRDYKRAEDEFSRFLQEEGVKKMPDAAFLLADYIGLGLSYEGLKEYSKAKDYYQKGIELIEKQRGALSGSEREQFLEGKVMGFPRLEPYEGMVRVLIKERGWDYQREALFNAERSKSKTFLEMLSARGIKGRTREDEILLEREKGYQQDLLVLKKRMEVMERLGAKGP